MDVRAAGPSFPHWIAQHAVATPERIFAQDAAGGELTYAQTQAAGDRWARAAAAVDVQAGTHVAVMIPTSLTFIECLLGLARVRAVPVPVNTDFKGRMFVHVLQNSQAELMLVSARYLTRLSDIAAQLTHLRRVVVIPDPGVDDDFAKAGVIVETLDAFLARGGDQTLPADMPKPSDVAGIIYTSGTTGASKGVMVPWGQLEASVTTLFPAGTPTPDDVYYVPLPLFHLSGWYGVLAMAMAGGRVVVRERFKTDAFWADVARFGCTTTLILGAMKEWLVAGVDDWPATTTLRNALIIPLGSTGRMFTDRLGVRVCTMFGMTETGHPIVSGAWNPTEAAGCGRVRDGYEVRVVDDDDQEVPDGTAGELLIRTTEPWRLNLGYWAMPEATLATWRNLWFHSGDYLRRSPDGSFFFVDRKKDAIRRRGENISSAEVEAEVMAHPGVLECAAIPVPSEFGEDEVMVYLARRPGETFSEADLIAFLEPRMPRFMVPRFIAIIPELPKTETEKIRKSALREQGLTPETWDREPGGRRSSDEHVAVAHD
ncbi:MAG TPA: AMP-binding protein [Micromonosporaceae bacterium]